MIFYSHRTRSTQRGVVLVASLLLLIVVTIIALSMFRSFGIQEKIAGNMREKQRALQAAESAQVFAEVWLMGNSTGPAVACGGGRLNGTLGQGQICANTLPTVVADVTSVPWTIGAQKIGVTYLPVNMSIKSIASIADLLNPSYFDTPTFYISDMGVSADAGFPGEVYQIDSYGYGGTSNTVAVVESTYVVSTSSSCLGGANC
jgi:type IV pilus assembly protein PilX